VGPGFIIPSIYGYERTRRPVPLKYGKLAAKYPWIYGYFLQCRTAAGHTLCVCACVRVCEGRSCASGRIDARPLDGQLVRRGFIRSPNWPGEYPVNVDCEWTIGAEPGRHVLVVVSRVDLAAAAAAAGGATGGDAWRTTQQRRHCPSTNSSSAHGDWLLVTDETGKGDL